MCENVLCECVRMFCASVSECFVYVRMFCACQNVLCECVRMVCVKVFECSVFPD